jgi:hypothetical protein
MTCDYCGAPCNGRLCRECELIEHNEEYHGVPADDSPDVRDWGKEGDDDE